MKIPLYLLALVLGALALAFAPDAWTQTDDDPLPANEMVNEIEHARENFWSSEEGLESLEEQSEGWNAEEQKETTEELREFTVEHLSEQTSGWSPDVIVIWVFRIVVLKKVV